MAKFDEIAHSGGKITFTTTVDAAGNLGTQLRYQNSRPVPAQIIGVYALWPGIVVEELSLGGIGTPWPVPKYPGSLPVLIGSDGEGKFGHHCPDCGQYWRSGSHPNFCPYCGISAPSFSFLSKAQLAYVQLYVEKLEEAGQSDEGSEIVIDLDEVADATLGRCEKPAFYISEERQQTLLNCAECGEFNDIIGRFGHCSVCYTRNDLAVLVEDVFPSLRADLDNKKRPEEVLLRAVSAFEVLIKNYVARIVEEVPMIPERKDKLSKSRFRDLDALDIVLSEFFGINIRPGIDEAAWVTCNRLIQRRHVYEHNGGVVDSEYVEKTGDTSVRIGELITEDLGSVHQYLSTTARIARAVHDGFHSMLPPRTDIIERHKARQKAHG
mgnify:CR=1 FL=1